MCRNNILKLTLFKKVRLITPKLQVRLITPPDANNVLLPSASSHIIQPLDVAVYGPLKKEWNNALDSFSREFKGLSMSRTRFFQVFDKAWKVCVEKKQSVVSGFRKCGIIPFNPNAVAYDRLIRASASASNRVSIVTDASERIGMERVFQSFERMISDEWRTLFSRR